MSLPMWERGLKRYFYTFSLSIFKSLPMWERGLKLIPPCVRVENLWSLPMWERGLKLVCNEHEKLHKCRSPCGSVD